MSSNRQTSIDWLISQLQKAKDFQRVLNQVSQTSSAEIDIIATARCLCHCLCRKLLQRNL